MRFCISSGDSGPNVRNLPYYAGMAAAFGLSKAEALKAVTLYPAQIMNVADRMGSIEVGKMANLVVTDGDLPQCCDDASRPSHAAAPCHAAVLETEVAPALPRCPRLPCA